MRRFFNLVAIASYISRYDFFGPQSNDYYVRWQSKMWPLWWLHHCCATLKIPPIPPCGICFSMYWCTQSICSLFFLRTLFIIFDITCFIFVWVCAMCVWMGIMRLCYHHSNQNPPSHIHLCVFNSFIANCMLVLYHCVDSYTYTHFQAFSMFNRIHIAHRLPQHLIIVLSLYRFCSIEN